jgi:hypothetical protein
VADDILLVDATNGGTTTEGAFTLAGEVRVGFIGCRLFRGGLNGGDPDDWFLRSDFNGDNGNGGNGPIIPPDELPPEALPKDLPATLPPGVYPINRPEIATYCGPADCPAAWTSHARHRAHSRPRRFRASIEFRCWSRERELL